ncbi:uncharacterized protein IL334_002682 [Kwoniella shivajii]|uniref:Translocation protein SEC62 n=1 Tax=Kwoniella shivajii TaxID=564305 RepID=A0ABZ1CX40_9TREE|nr:hypothetical protein IL334_002682 [Kwoniella shivajii]
MSKKLTELEAAALTSFTPAGQAALYNIHLAQQAEKDERDALKAAEEKKKKLLEDVRPEEVRPGEVVDGWIQEWCPPLYQFLDIFAAPHLAIGIFILFHMTYWYTTPWYIHFLIPWPTIYLIPIYCTWKCMKNPKDRVLLLSYWPILCVLEYLEILLFRDQARSMVWWPKLKAIFCFVIYCVIDNDVILDSRGKPKDKKPVYGAVKLIERFLPSPPEEKSKDAKEKDRKTSEDKDKDRRSSREKKSSRGKDEKDKKKAK